MAKFARGLGVIQSYALPTGCVGMAERTAAGVMVAGDGRRVAGFTFKDSGVIKLGGRPTVYDVAALAVATEMVGVEAVGGQLVTTVAGGAGLPVTAVVMTGETVQIGVAAG